MTNIMALRSSNHVGKKAETVTVGVDMGGTSTRVEARLGNERLGLI